MKIKFKKLSPHAVIPTKGKPGDAGVDLTAISKEKTVTPGGWYIEYDTGIAVEIPTGFVGLAFPRSSNSNFNSILSNSVGVIDETYRGSIRLRFKPSDYRNMAELDEHEINTRVGQLLIFPIVDIEPEETDTLTETNRNEKGFGSSGL